MYLVTREHFKHYKAALFVLRETQKTSNGVGGGGGGGGGG